MSTTPQQPQPTTPPPHHPNAMTPKHPSKPPNFTCRTAGPERLTVAQPPCPQTTAHPPTISRHDMYPNKPTTPAHTPHNQHTYKQTSTDTHTHTPTAHRSSTHACTHTHSHTLTHTHTHAAPCYNAQCAAACPLSHPCGFTRPFSLEPPPHSQTTQPFCPISTVPYDPSSNCGLKLKI